MKDIIEFLRNIAANNDREWFNENKPRYTEVQAQANALAEELIEAISRFDDSVSGLTAKDCTYRIYRDTRFSHDKSPYKTHIGIFVSPGGKHGRMVGYYFHIDPSAPDEQDRYFMVTGTYGLSTREMNSVREDIVMEGEAFVAAVNKAKGFKFGSEEMYKRVPNGFPADSPYAVYLRQKNFQLIKHLTEEYVTGGGLAERLAAEFRKTLDFKERINKAIEFAREEK